MNAEGHEDRISDVMQGVGRPSAIVASAHHTGTWCALSTLQVLGLDVVELRQVIERNVKLQTGDVLHWHYAGRGINSRGETPFTPETLLAWADELRVPVITPMRDPLLALIARQQRHPDQTHTFILEAIAGIAERWEAGIHALWWTVDLPSSVESRLHAMRMLAAAVNCHEPGVACAETKLAYDHARLWPVVNTRGVYPLKSAYYARDVETLQEALGSDWDALLDMRVNPAVRRLYSHLGYRWGQALWWAGA